MKKMMSKKRKMRQQIMKSPPFDEGKGLNYESGDEDVSLVEEV